MKSKAAKRVWVLREISFSRVSNFVFPGLFSYLYLTLKGPGVESRRQRLEQEIQMPEILSRGIITTSEAEELFKMYVDSVGRFVRPFTSRNADISTG